MSIHDLPGIVRKMTLSNFPNEDEQNIFWATTILLAAMTPDRNEDQVFHFLFDSATKSKGNIQRWYMMAACVASGIRQLSDEDLNFIASLCNPVDDLEPEPDSLDVDLRLKRCLTCDGMFDTPTGDYCPRCQYAISEDDGAADLDLFG